MLLPQAHFPVAQSSLLFIIMHTTKQQVIGSFWLKISHLPPAWGYRKKKTVFFVYKEIEIVIHTETDRVDVLCMCFYDKEAEKRNNSNQHH